MGPAALTAELRKVHQYDVFSTGAPLQAALAHFLPTKEGVAHLDGLASMYQAKRDRLLAGLAGTPWRFTPAQGGFFQVLDARDIVPGDDGHWARTWTRTHGLATIPPLGLLHAAHTASAALLCQRGCHTGCGSGLPARHCNRPWQLIGSTSSACKPT